MSDSFHCAKIGIFASLQVGLKQKEAERRPIEFLVLQTTFLFPEKDFLYFQIAPSQLQ